MPHTQTYLVVPFPLPLRRRYGRRETYYPNTPSPGSGLHLTYNAVLPTLEDDNADAFGYTFISGSQPQTDFKPG